MDQLAELLGNSPGIVALRERIRTLLSRQQGARRPVPVLIQGETGTGKGLLARLMHGSGPRAAGPFIEVNCAAIPETLLEGEMFGHERGAFTDARQAKAGLFHAAHSGTLFLDEVGLLPKGLQAKLLTAIEQRSVRRLGSTRAEAVDVAIIAATNADLAAAVRTGGFREDLYHRLAVFPIDIPPLRQRGDDVDLLAERLLARICAEYGLPARTLGPDARAALSAHAWPGNVRELSNVLERAALLSDSAVISAGVLELPRPAPAPGVRAEPPTADRERLRRERLAGALETTGWNISRTAAMLGITRNTVRAQIERYRLGRGASGTGAPAVSSRAPASAEPATGEVMPPAVRWRLRRVTFLLAAVELSPAEESPAAVQALERGVEKAHTFGGRVEELGRTRVLAAFGHEPAEDAPRRAANAAIAIVKAVERDRLAQEPSRRVATTIAIHVERVPVAQVGGAVKIDRDTLGLVRGALDEMAGRAAGEIAVSDATLPFLTRHFELRRPPGGGNRLVGRGARPALEEPGFVGRREETDLLHVLLDRTMQGRGQAVTLIGEPGIGKSRLVGRFRQVLGRLGVSAVEGHCVSYGVDVPYGPVVELLRGLCGIDDDDAPDTAGTKVVHALEDLGPAVAPAIPYMALLVDPGRVIPPATLSPEAIKARTFEAVRRLIDTRQERGPLVLIVEDLHWVDRTSEALLASIAGAIAGTRVMILATCRPGYQAPWTGRPHATQISVGPLSPQDSRQLTESVLGPERADDALVRTIVDRGDGNPFFLEELARAARDEEPGAASRMPATVHDVLAARIDGLPEADRHALQAAAVLGGDLSVALLDEVCEACRDVPASLARLAAAEFLTIPPAGAAGAHAFKHALTHEVAYESLTGADRARLHARAAAAIARLSPDAAARRPEVFGHHYTAAGLADEAIPYWHRAGEQAIRRSANAEAIAHLTRGLSLLEQTPASAERARRELGLRLALASAQAELHGFGSVQLEATLGKVRRLADQIGHRPELVPVRFGLWRFSLSRASLATASELAAELLLTSEQHPDPSVLVAAHTAMGATSFYRGDLPRAHQHLSRLTEWLESAARPESLVAYNQDAALGGLGYLGWTLTLMGAPDRGAETADHALARARELGHPFTLALALNSAGLVRCDRREPDRARAHGEEMLALAREQRFEFFTALAMVLTGWARFAQGDRADGLRLMREGTELYHGTHQRVGLRHRAQLAEAWLAAGHVEQALATADEARAHAAATQDAIFLSEIHRVRAEAIWAHAPGDAAALEGFRLAVDVALAQGARWLALRAATALARRWRTGAGALQAGAALRGVLAGLHEGAGLFDLTEAKAALDPGPDA